MGLSGVLSGGRRAPRSAFASMGTQLVNMALGIWLMAAPAVMGYTGAARTNHLIIGPVIAAFAWIATAECTRGLRRGNLPLAVWLVIAPLLIDHEAVAGWNSLATGIAVALFSSFGGGTAAQFGGGWGLLWNPRKPRA